MNEREYAKKYRDMMRNGSLKSHSPLPFKGGSTTKQTYVNNFNENEKP